MIQRAIPFMSVTDSSKAKDYRLSFLRLSFGHLSEQVRRRRQRISFRLHGRIIHREDTFSICLDVPCQFGGARIRMNPILCLTLGQLGTEVAVMPLGQKPNWTVLEKRPIPLLPDDCTGTLRKSQRCENGCAFACPHPRAAGQRAKSSCLAQYPTRK